MLTRLCSKIAETLQFFELLSSLIYELVRFGLSFLVFKFMSWCSEHLFVYICNDETGRSVGMNIFERMGSWFSCQPDERRVALVLSGGGARGLAHIGAIDELVARGYTISSIAGTSMGALIGGLWAAGQLDAFRQELATLDRRRILALMGISLGLDHVATGEKLMVALEGLIGDRKIEDLSVDFCCVASDIVSGREMVFREGPLLRAIRASISIPGFFSPVIDGECVLVDGSVHNTLPLDRVVRRESDLLVAVNVSAPDDEPYVSYLKPNCERHGSLDSAIRSHFPFNKIKFSENYFNMALRVARLTIQNNTQMALRLTPPDVYAQLPMCRYSLFDYDRAEEIIAYGREEMSRKLDEFEKK